MTSQYGCDPFIGRDVITAWRVKLQFHTIEVRCDVSYMAFPQLCIAQLRRFVQPRVATRARIQPFKRGIAIEAVKAGRSSQQQRYGIRTLYDESSAMRLDSSTLKDGL
ncbi:hypothetical protein D3C85_1050890 [compost metagenome]